MNNLYVFPVLLVPIHDCLKRLWNAVKHRHIQTLSTPHARLPVAVTRLASCRLVSNYALCCPTCPTIVFSFSKYSFAVTPDVYLESPPNIQFVETSSRQIIHREPPSSSSSSPSSSFIASRTRPHFIDCEHTSMYPYTIHIHACMANISVDRARAWTEENGRVVEGNMGGSHNIKI